MTSRRGTALLESRDHSGATATSALVAGVARDGEEGIGMG